MIKKFYLKLLMSLMLVALAVPQVMAETLTVADQGSAYHRSFPIYGLNYDVLGTKSQMIYPASLLQDMDGSAITEITFYSTRYGGGIKFGNPSSSYGAGELTVKLAVTSLTEFESASYVTLSNEVTATVIPVYGSDQLKISFDEPLTYTAGSNLIIQAEVTVRGGYGTTYFDGESNTDGAYSYCSDEGVKSYFMPKTTFTYEDASTDPTIRVDNNALNFSALVGSSVTSTVAVTGKNLTGDITATIEGAGFSVNPETLGTTGGDLTITYAPTAAGTHTGTLTLSSAGADDVVISLNGTAEAPITSGSVTPPSLSFETYAGVATTQTITIENTGNTAFTPSFTVAAPFSIEAATEIAAGASKDFTVTYTPTAVGTDNGTLNVDINGTTTNVTLTGTANVAPQEVTVANNGTDESSKLPVNGNYFDTQNSYGQTIYNKSDLGLLANKNITKVKYYSNTVFNSSKIAGTVLEIYMMETDQNNTVPEGGYSSQPLDFSGATVLGEYTVQGNETTGIEFILSTPFTYSGNKNLAIQVKVKTKSPQSGLCYQDITWIGKDQNDNNGYSYGTSGTGVAFLPKTTFSYQDAGATPVITVDPATVETFSTEVGTPKTATVNVSGENLTGDITATISGDNADCFTAALENGVLTITYNPTAAGNHTATLTLSSTGAEPVVINLTGTATAAQPYAVTVNPENGYDFGNVLVDNTKVWTLTVTNNGTQPVTPTLTGLEAPFSTTYTAAPLAAGESISIEITFAPTAVEDYTNAITLSFPETTIDNYTYELTGKGVDSFEPTADNEVVKLITVDKRSIYEPNFIDTANGNTTPQQLNCYDMRFKMAQPDDPAKQIKAGDLHPGNNLYEFYAIDDFGTEFRFATINLFAEGQPSSNPSVSAMDAPIKVTPSVEYYTEDGMPVHSTHKHNTTLNYTEKTYNDINDLVDLEGVIDYVNDTWSANTATNAHPDHYKFQIRGVGQYGDMVTSLTAEYVESHMTGYGDQLVMPEGWERGSFAGPNNEASDDVHTFYYYDLYIKKSFFDERGITGPVTVVVNTTLSGSGFNADNYKAMSVNGVEQIIAKEEFKDYSWTVPLLDEIPSSSIVEQVPMGVVIRLVSTGADFNRTTGIYIYGGGTGVSNVDTVNIYKSSMNVKAYTQKQVDDDTDRSLVAMRSGDTNTANADVNVLAYGDAAVTGYKLNENSSASTTGMNQVATATHNENGSYTVNSVSAYNATYDFVRDESLGNINGMWLPMYPADPSKYFLPITVANGVGDDGVVRSNNNTYGSAMQQVEKNGSVDFSSSKCYKSTYTWVKNGVEYAIYNPEVELTSVLPAETGYQLYNYRLWVDYDENAPAWDFDENLQLIGLMDRPLYSGQDTHIGGTGAQERKDSWAFVAPADLDKVKLVARFYYKKNSTGKARPTDKDRLYYVVENQVEIPTNQIITGIDNVANKNVAGVKYYNLAGIESDVPFQGVNIEVITFTDGSRSSRKIMK